MNVLVIEDEALAAKRLIAILNKLDVNVLAHTQSIQKSVTWLRKHQHELDLIFSDIQLEDGNSFEIFEEVTLKVPVVFTTAFTEFALQAFEVNSVDYLLKPFSEKSVAQALTKYRAALGYAKEHIVKNIGDFIRELPNNQRYKVRFLTRVGANIKMIITEDIVLLFSQYKGVYAVLKDGSQCLLDGNLEQVFSQLSPKHFFQINRKAIVAAHADINMKSYSNSRIKITVPRFNDFDLIVARERVKDFKQWLQFNA